MAYVQPHGEIFLLGGVPCDSNYDNTLYFEEETQQIEYFKSKHIRHLSKQMYTRIDAGIIRVALSENDINRCNYLMFNNGIGSDKYINKWYYAFITRVDYVADNRYDVHFTIDVLQTWHFNYELGQCFVEREHTKTDNLYEHLLDEDIETGEPIAQEVYNFDFSGATKLLIYYYLNNDDKADYDGFVVNKMYVGFKMWFVDMNAAKIDGVIAKIQDMNGTIFSATVVPASWGTTTDEGITAIDPSVSGTYKIKEEPILNDYVPANKKLFNYPYSYLLAINNVGQKVVLRKELFDIKKDGIFNTFEFTIKGTPSPTPVMILYPKDYEGVSDNYEHSLIFNQFPESPVVTDSYAAWWAQNKNSYITSMISTSISGATAISGATGKAVLDAGRVIAGDITAIPSLVGSGSALSSSVVSTASNIASLIAKKADMKNAPDSLINMGQSANLLTAIGRMGFTIILMSLHKENLIIADNFFTMFGYACKEVKTPNRNVRKYFTYTKTNGCKIYPIEYNLIQPNHGVMRDIENIYDKGVRFWHYTRANSIGDFTVNNSVIEGG